MAQHLSETDGVPYKTHRHWGLCHRTSESTVDSRTCSPVRRGAIHGGAPNGALVRSHPRGPWMGRATPPWPPRDSWNLLVLFFLSFSAGLLLIGATLGLGLCPGCRDSRSGQCLVDPALVRHHPRGKTWICGISPSVPGWLAMTNPKNPFALRSSSLNRDLKPNN